MSRVVWTTRTDVAHVRQCLKQLAPNRVDEVGIRAVLHQRVGRQLGEVLRDDPVGGRGPQPLQLGHAVQDRVAAGACALWVASRVQRGRRRDDAGERRRLVDVEVGGRDAEVPLRGGVQPDGVASERHQVEVAVEDLVLVQGPLHLRGGGDLAQLAPVRTPVTGRGHVHVLLGDGGRALLDPPAAQVGGGGTQDAGQGEPVVLEEAMVLGRQDRTDGVFGQVVGRDLFPDLAGVQVLDLVAVDVQQDGGRCDDGGAGGRHGGGQVVEQEHAPDDQDEHCHHAHEHRDDLSPPSREPRRQGGTGRACRSGRGVVVCRCQCAGSSSWTSRR